MSDEKDIEKLFRDRFSNYQPTPSDGLWDKIEDDLAGLAAKPTLPWWRKFLPVLLISFIGLIGSASIYFYNTLSEKENIITADQKTIKSKETQSLNKNDIKETSKVSKLSARNQGGLEKKSNKLKFQDTENKLQKESDVAKASLFTSNEESDPYPQTQKNINPKNQSNVSKRLIVGDEKNESNKLTNKVQDDYSDNLKTTSTNRFQSIKVNENITSQSTRSEIVEKKSETNSNNGISSSNKEGDIKTVSVRRMPIRKSNLSLYTQNPSQLVGSTLDEEKDKPYTPAPLAFFISGYGGPSMVFRRFESDHNLMHNHKQEAESGMLSYDWGIEIGAAKGKWEWSIGFQFERLGENYAYEGMQEVHDTSISQHQHPQDPTQFIYDTAVTVHHNHVTHNSSNTYNYITIPVNIGYRLNVGQNLTLTPTLTTGINVLSSAQTAWLDPESLNPVLHNSEDHQDAFRKVNFSNRIQLGFYYQMSEHFQLLVRPEATILWQSVFNNDEFLNHRPYSFDANVGLRYTF